MRTCSLITLSTLLWSLSCGGNLRVPEADNTVEIPGSFGSTASIEAPPPGLRCIDFGEAELDQLVSRAFEDNLDLQVAVTRVEQAEALVDATAAGFWPQIGGNFSAGRSRTSAPGPLGPVETDQFQASASASYEIDVWGKVRHARSAADADFHATGYDRDALAISVVSQLANAWLDRVYHAERDTLLNQQIQTATSFLELTKFRAGQGRGTALDVTQQEEQREALRGQLALVQSAKTLAEHRVALLLGKPPNTKLVATTSLPSLPPTPEAGLPAALLENRPDIRAAYRRIEAADARILSAVAERYPSLQLSSNVFLQAAELGNLIDEVFWSVTGLVSQSVFDGGRRAAGVRQAEAAAHGRLIQYGQTILGALREVEDALVLEESQESYVASLEKQLNFAQKSLQLARERYRQGTLDYLRVLGALQSVQRLEQAVLDARRQQFNYRIQLCGALGGTWKATDQSREVQP